MESSMASVARQLSAAPRVGSRVGSTAKPACRAVPHRARRTLHVAAAAPQARPSGE